MQPNFTVAGLRAGKSEFNLLILNGRIAYLDGELCSIRREAERLAKEVYPAQLAA